MELGIDYIIRELGQNDGVTHFKMGDKAHTPLKTFLAKQALYFHLQSIAKTYVAVAVEPEGESAAVKPCVVGYVTLLCSEIDIRNGYDLHDCPQASRYETLPAVKIARLAIDSRHRRKGIGDQLVSLAIATTVTNIAPFIGCRFIVTDAKAEAIPFYEKLGFTLLDTEYNRNLPQPVMFLDILRTLEGLV